MKNSVRFIVSSLLIFTFVAQILPCGPSYLTPVFESSREPDEPFENFAAGRIGIIKPSYRRIVLFAAYRYLNNGTFNGAEQKALIDVWNAEFKNKEYQDNDVGEAVKAWVEKRKEVVGKEEKLPEIYTEREYGGYDFFPNCTKSAFETAAETLSARISSHGSDNREVKAWLEAQDKVFTNCSSGKQTPAPPDASMPEWLQKDRAYQLAAAEFYSLDYEKAKSHFREISQDANSPWQDTADYLVGRTLLRQASLSKDDARSAQFYGEAEQHLQSYAARSGRFRASAERLLGLIKYRLRPQERIGELARNLSYAGTSDFRQDLIDYNWLMDKFETETLQAEDKRKRELKEQEESANVSVQTETNTAVTNTNTETKRTETELEIFLHTDDYAKSWRIYLKPGATDAEAIIEAERVTGMALTEKMKERLFESKKYAYSNLFSQNYTSGYTGGYYGEEELSLSVLPDFLRREDLTDWLFTFQIQNAESYLYALSKYKQNGSDLWLMTALTKADSNSAELGELLEAADGVSPSSPAYPTVAYNTSRILLEQNKRVDARKMLDEILESPLDLPVSSRNQFLELRMRVAETLEDFLKYSLRKPYAFDQGGRKATIDAFIEEQKSWYNAEYYTQSKAEYEREVEESYREERLWQERLMFDTQTIEIINEHFPLKTLSEAEKSPALPDYMRKRFALAIWTRAALLQDFATAERIAPELVRHLPEAEELMKSFQAAKTPQAKWRAALYLILKNEQLNPYIPSGLGTPAESYKMMASRWWCEPYYSDYDEETGESVPYRISSKPIFLTAQDSEAAQKELRKLKEMGDAPKFLGEKVLEWARLAPADKRLPESLYIVFEANGWDKYGCGNNMELHAEIGNVLKKRYPQSEWTQKVLDMERESN